MEALTNVIEKKIIKKRILPSRSGDDGAPCAIARLVLVQAPISNQQKPKHTNLPQKMYLKDAKIIGLHVTDK